ncbi:MAG: hypothetical protein M1819_005321 [Sarea resinae]|nr:MAG: hypothetical protein M1819_005321 [Sarea resinae]
MATIKAIEGRSVHQIQSGQVIVDLSSVVKELVENSLDAGATSIEVRFKNHGLESIEVQDNGGGIAPENYQSLALKHYTSKLSTYADLESLQTFGFRGEALSSLCAVSKFSVVTTRAEDAPKGTRLEFESSGQLKGTQVVASQKGTSVAVEDLFRNLPVRRKELEKNIKREYGKVLGLLHAYACISVGVRLSVSNQMGSKKTVVFSTKANQTTRENIANVFGAKTLGALVPLDLKLEMQPTTGPRRLLSQKGSDTEEVRILGHISRPIFGEGRQTPDRQMFFVNTRPCGLPQISKAFNEVYKSYNVTQSPFIFADFKINTDAYDVNVSPDKRTILLHDQSALLENLKTSLAELFDSQEQTVPQSQLGTSKLPSFRQLTIDRERASDSQNLPLPNSDPRIEDGLDKPVEPGEDRASADGSRDISNGDNISLIQSFVGRNSRDRVEKNTSRDSDTISKIRPNFSNNVLLDDDYHSEPPEDERDTPQRPSASNIAVRNFNERIAEAGKPSRSDAPIPTVAANPSTQVPGVVQNAFDRMRPKRTRPETATITIGERTVTSPIGTPALKRHKALNSESNVRRSSKHVGSQQFSKSLRAFAAPGTQDEEVDDPGPDMGSAVSESGQTFDEPTRIEDDEAIDMPERADQVASSPELADEDDLSDHQDEEEGISEHGAEVEEEEEEKEENSEDSDSSYIDDATKKAREEAKVQSLITSAEAKSALPSSDALKRVTSLLKSGQYGRRKDSTTKLVGTLNTSVKKIEEHISQLTTALDAYTRSSNHTRDEQQGHSPDKKERLLAEAKTAEDRLTLTVTKSDFQQMRIIGQFNLGFILALRPSVSPRAPSTTTTSADLFIIDQHASSEKATFEALVASTTLTPQPLVHALPLSLTAVQEEIILDHLPLLTRNGFGVALDASGARPVGQRARLLALPSTKEVVFDVGDLEELIALIAENPPPPLPSSPSPSSSSSLSTTTPSAPQTPQPTPIPTPIPRPSKIRKLLAMRACRSSIMIGTALSHARMRRVVADMAALDKPWNCPHGRPTLRHLCALGPAGGATGGGDDGDDEGYGYDEEGEGKGGGGYGTGDDGTGFGVVDAWTLPHPHPHTPNHGRGHGHGHGHNHPSTPNLENENEKAASSGGTQDRQGRQSSTIKSTRTRTRTRKTRGEKSTLDWGAWIRDTRERFGSGDGDGGGAGGDGGMEEDDDVDEDVGVDVDVDVDVDAGVDE